MPSEQQQTLPLVGMQKAVFGHRQSRSSNKVLDCKLGMTVGSRCKWSQDGTHTSRDNQRPHKTRVDERCLLELRAQAEVQEAG